MELTLEDHTAYTIMRGTKPSSGGDDHSDVAELLATVIAFDAGALICTLDDQIPVANFQDALLELHRIVTWCPRDAYAARRRWIREYFRIACKAIREALQRG